MGKFSKFRNSPEQFFFDSRQPVVRLFGKVVGARFLYNETVLNGLENPMQVIASSTLPGVNTITRNWLQKKQTQRRRLVRKADNPLVSVVIAALNAEPEIEQSLASLQSQSYNHLEIIVVDDGSSDRTAEVVRAMTKTDSRIRLLRNLSPTGAAMARNRGLRETTGGYITFQDADDISHPERIERQLAALLGSSACVCVCNSRRESYEGERIVVNGRRFSKNFIAMMFPRYPVFTTIGYMMDLRVGEDSEYYERIKATYGDHSEIHLFETLYRQLFSPDSLLFSNSQTQQNDEGLVEYTISEEVRRPLDKALSRLPQIRANELSPFVPFSDAKS